MKKFIATLIFAAVLGYIGLELITEFKNLSDSRVQKMEKILNAY